MDTFLLTTKLRIPPQPQRAVRRTRLIDALECCIPQYKLSLISAPEPDHALFESPLTESPHVGCASTTGDLYRFGEMLRRGGELDGTRILSPRMLQLGFRVTF